MALNTLPNAGLTSRGYPSDRIVTPIIINGDMSVAQRSTSVTGVGDGDTGYHTLDRWRFSEGGDNSTVFTMSQDTNVPTGQGFAKSLKMDVTTADGSPGSSDAIFLQQRFEGQNLQLLKKGTSSAEKITVSFWVSSSKTGTYILELQDSDNTRNCSQSYTISSADTWEKKVVVFPADTTGAIDNDNANSFEVNWWLLAGTDFTSGTLATSFASRTNANRAVGQVNVGDSTSNNFYMTGCQLEVGEFDSTSIPSFPFESQENNLRKCMRYYENFTASGSHKASTVFGSASARCYFEYKVKKRSTPTVTISQSAGNGAGNVSFLTKAGSYVGTIGTHEILNSAIDGFNLNIASGYGSTGWSEGFAVMFYVNGNNYEVWTADAEL